MEHIHIQWVNPHTCTFDIRVPAHLRSQGHGTAAMYDLIEWADEVGVALEVWCEPDPELCSPGKLAAWYTRFGFERTGETMPGAIRMLRPVA